MAMFHDYVQLRVPEENLYDFEGDLYLLRQWPWNGDDGLGPIVNSSHGNGIGLEMARIW